MRFNFSTHILVVALAVATLATGEALAKNGHGGPGGGGGGGGGGGNSSSHHGSSGTGSGRSSGHSQSFSQSGGGGGSQSGMSTRSFRSSGGDSGPSWSGGGGGKNSPRTFSADQSPRFRANSGGDQGSSNQFRRITADQKSGSSAPNNSPANTGPTTDGPSLKNWQANDNNGGKNGSNGRYTVGRPSDDQIRAFLKKDGNSSSDNGAKDLSQLQQAKYNADNNSQSQGGDGRQSDRGRQANWLNNNKGDGDKPGSQTLGNQFPGQGNKDNKDGSNDRNRGKNGNPWAGNSNNNGSLNGSNQALKKFNRDSQSGNNFNNGNNGKNRDFVRDGNWSKNGDKASDKTSKWFGKSGFGDHRDLGDKHDNHVDAQFADTVKKNWKNKWDNDGNGNHGPGQGSGNHDGNHHDGDHHDGDHHGNNGHNNHHNYPFNYGWWNGHNNLAFNLYWRNDCWHQPYFWWRPCTAPLLTTWIDFGWNTPCYWDYGPGEYITYYHDAVYVGGNRYATTLDYYAQVSALAHSVPTLTQDQLANMDWMPLGVFAVTHGGQSNEVLQLAVSKEGILSGTFFNQATGVSRPLQGMVEQATQRAAWCFADGANSGPIVETSLYNLTESECTALAHTGPVSRESWRLVRLEQPETTGAETMPAP